VIVQPLRDPAADLDGLLFGGGDRQRRVLLGLPPNPCSRVRPLCLRVEPGRRDDRAPPRRPVPGAPSPRPPRRNGVRCTAAGPRSGRRKSAAARGTARRHDRQERRPARPRREHRSAGTGRAGPEPSACRPHLPAVSLLHDATPPRARLGAKAHTHRDLRPAPAAVVRAPGSSGDGRAGLDGRVNRQPTVITRRRSRYDHDGAGRVLAAHPGDGPEQHAGEASETAPADLSLIDPQAEPTFPPGPAE
jgi:hypothetical protein